MAENKTRILAEEREYVDPQERIRPMPIVAVLVGIGMFVWGIVYLLMAGPIVPYQYGDARTLTALTGSASDSDSGEVDGAAVFASTCAACHQATGTGVPGVFPPLVGSEWVGANAGVMVNIVLHGLEGEIDVEGTSYNGQMPPFGHLSDAEIAAVVSHVRTSWGNDGDTIDADFVKTTRDADQVPEGAIQGGAALKELEEKLAS